MRVPKTEKYLNGLRSRLRIRFPPYRMEKNLPPCFLSTSFLLKWLLISAKLFSSRVREAILRIRGRYHIQQSCFHGNPLLEKIFRSHRSRQIHVVVKKYELLSQIRDTVQPELDHIGIECGKILWRNIFFMTDNPEPGCSRFNHGGICPSVTKKIRSPRGRNTLRLETVAQKPPVPDRFSVLPLSFSSGEKNALLRFHFESFPSTHNITKSILSLTVPCPHRFSCAAAPCSPHSDHRSPPPFISHVLHLSNSSFVTLPSR